MKTVGESLADFSTVFVLDVSIKERRMVNEDTIHERSALVRCDMSSRTNTLRKGLIRASLLRFNECTEMNERKSIDRKLLTDLAKEVGLNTSHLEVLGERQHWEIVVGDDMLEWLAVMDDDEYRGFYIEVPRPTPEEWGDAKELIASGEYDSREAFLADWRAFNPMEARWFHVASTCYVDVQSLRVSDQKRTRFILTNLSACADGGPMMRGVGRS